MVTVLLMLNLIVLTSILVAVVMLLFGVRLKRRRKSVYTRRGLITIP